MGLRKEPRDPAIVNFYWDNRGWIFVNLDSARDSLVGARKMAEHYRTKLAKAEGLVERLEEGLERAERVLAERAAEKAAKHEAKYKA